MPRPVKDDPRDCFKTFRFTEAEVTQLERRARSSNRTLSAYVRMILLESQEAVPPAEPAPATAREKMDAYWRRRQQGLGADPVTRSREPAVRVLAEQMRRVGVNLNQIAARMNELRIPPPRDLPAVISEIRAYVRQAREP